jgi:hypothetical protein
MMKQKENFFSFVMQYPGDSNNALELCLNSVEKFSLLSSLSSQDVMEKTCIKRTMQILNESEDDETNFSCPSGELQLFSDKDD